MGKIVQQGHPVLREVAKSVPKEMFGTNELKNIIAKMGETLAGTPHGVAIAAPQIGISYRIFLVAGFTMTGNERGSGDPDKVFINPIIKRRSRKKIPVEGEGCLSVNGIYGVTLRPEKMTVTAYDAEGKKFEYGASDFLAAVFEHEIDHLDGILFVDKTKNLWREVPKSKNHEEN